MLFIITLDPSISEMEQAVNMSQSHVRCDVKKNYTFARPFARIVLPYSFINEQLRDYAFASGAFNRQVRTFAPSTYNYFVF